jgi:hypothetical protein
MIIEPLNINLAPASKQNKQADKPEIVNLEQSASSQAKSTALMIITPKAYKKPALTYSAPQASFIAHLIATRDHAPQTRLLRRETPDQAIKLYGQTSNSLSGAKEKQREYLVL